MMKKTFLFNLFLPACFFLAGGCKKETVVVPPPTAEPEPVHLTDLGKIEMVRDGKSVTLAANMFLNDSHFSISTALNPIKGTNIKEGIHFDEIPFKTGKYPVSKYNYLKDGLVDISLYWVVIDELIGSLESIDTSQNDFIEVITVDAVNLSVEGRFQFHLKNVDGTDLSPYGLPDSLHFTEGVFYLKVQ